MLFYWLLLRSLIGSFRWYWVRVEWGSMHLKSDSRRQYPDKYGFVPVRLLCGYSRPIVVVPYGWQGFLLAWKQRTLSPSVSQICFQVLLPPHRLNRSRFWFFLRRLVSLIAHHIPSDSKARHHLQNQQFCLQAQLFFVGFLHHKHQTVRLLRQWYCLVLQNLFYASDYIFMLINDLYCLKRQ